MEGKSHCFELLKRKKNDSSLVGGGDVVVAIGDGYYVCVDEGMTITLPYVPRFDYYGRNVPANGRDSDYYE